MAGLAPADGPAVQTQVGTLARQFLLQAAQANRYQKALAGIDLTKAPYSLDQPTAALLASAVGAAVAAYGAADLTFLTEVAGLF